MNKDKNKMIDDVTTIFSERCCEVSHDVCSAYDDYCRTCYALALYDANYRKIADDEIVLKKNEHDKLLLAQYAARKTIDEIFSLSLEKIEEAKKETAREIFAKAFATLSKCAAEDGFFATESDSDVSINGNVVWFELKKLANEFGIEVGEVE